MFGPSGSPPFQCPIKESQILRDWSTRLEVDVAGSGIGIRFAYLLYDEVVAFHEPDYLFIGGEEKVSCDGNALHEPLFIRTNALS